MRTLPVRQPAPCGPGKPEPIRLLLPGEHFTDRQGNLWRKIGKWIPDPGNRLGHRHLAEHVLTRRVREFRAQELVRRLDLP